MKKIYLKKMLWLSFTIILLLSACHEKEDQGTRKEKTIFTTIYPIQYIVEQVAGEFAHVQSIYPPGVDAHTYEPTSKDMTQLAKSDAFIYFGSTMEAFVESAEASLKNEQVELVSLEEYDELFETKDKQSSLERNPHVWIDPLRMVSMTDIVTDQLIEMFPEKEALLKENKKDVITDLKKLDEEFKERISPLDGKYLIVPHAAYHYWEESYGIEEIPISGLSPSEEPSQRYLAKIIETAKQYQINFLFYEQNTPDKLIEVVRDEIDAQTYTIHNLSILTEDDLQNNEDYLSIMKRNIDVLEEAFSQ